MKRINKIISVILAVITAALAFNAAAFAATGDSTFYVGDDIVVTIDGATKTLTVSGTGALPDYSSGGAVPWYNNSYAEHVVIEDGITAIGNRCFYYSKAKDVVMADSVVRIGASAFSNAKSLSSITLSKNIKRVEDYAFYSTALTSISFEEGLEYVGASAFANSASLSVIELPEGIEYFDGTAFQSTALYKSLPVGISVVCGYTTAYKGTLSAASAAIPDGAKVVSAYTISGNSKVTEVTIPDSVEEIHGSAFYNNTLLKSVTVPDSVTRIGDFAIGYKSDSTYFTPVALAGVTIYGHAGFEAERYASAYGFGFVCLCEDGAVETYPDCLTGGDATVVCKYCSKVISSVYVAPKDSHSFSSPETVEPTCTEDGFTRKVCAVCGKEEIYDVIPASGHTPDYESPVIEEATCVDRGRIYFACSVCGDAADEIFIPAAGHRAADEPVVTEPTCTEQGFSDTVCAVCGDLIEREFLPPKGHTPNAEWTVLIKSDIHTVKQGFRVLMCRSCGVAIKYGYYLAGDINNDGLYTTRDLALLKRCLTDHTPEEAILEACDINGDGRITIADLSAYKKFLAN